MSNEPEDLFAPSPLASFAFWGQNARLVLPPGSAEVLLDYLTEPPHGDPLYSVRVNRFTLGGWKSPLPCFGRDLHVSPCLGFLALTSLRNGRCSFHVVDLVRERLWSRPGFVTIESVSAREVCVHPHIEGGNQRQRSPVQPTELDARSWRPFLDPVP